MGCLAGMILFIPFIENDYVLTAIYVVFIVALLIGTITGTYSSPFIATPILVWLEKRNKK